MSSGSEVTCGKSNQVSVPSYCQSSSCPIVLHCESCQPKHLHFPNTCSDSHIFLRQGQNSSLLSGSHLDWIPASLPASGLVKLTRSHHEVSASYFNFPCALHASPKGTHLVERGGHDLERGRLDIWPNLQPHTYERGRPSWIWCAGYHSSTSTWSSGRTLGPHFSYNHYNRSPNYYKVYRCHWIGTGLLKKLFTLFWIWFLSNIYFSLISCPYSPLVEEDLLKKSCCNNIWGLFFTWRIGDAFSYCLKDVLLCASLTAWMDWQIMFR